MIELEVKDMTCGHCVRAVTDSIRALDPQANVRVELERGRVAVEGKPGAAELIAAVQAAGYPAAVASSQAPASAARRGCCCG